MRARLRAVLLRGRFRSLALAVLFHVWGAQRLAAAGGALGLRLRPRLLPRRRLVGLREPARLRRDARGARRDRDLPLLRLPRALSRGRGLARAAPRPRRATGARSPRCPAAFVAFEWLRGWLFTGFPWLTLGTSQAPASPLAGFAPLVGGYGVSLAVAVAAALARRARRAAPAWSRAARCARSAALAALFVAGGAAARWSSGRAPAGAPVAVALLQGNVPQNLKCRDDVRAQTLARLPRA